MDVPYIVHAEFSFKGSNNDELCFKKGDIITVTQREEGGWWEGTLGDTTGWFPSNYVKEYKPSSHALAETAIRLPEEIQAYRSLVLNDLLESERAHVAEIRGLLENFLEPLASAQIPTTDEYAQLMCNFVDIVETHEDLLQSIEECNDRVGKLFLTKAPFMKSVHKTYCAAHPRAIVILDKYKDELESFMEKQGAASPGLLVLTTGLSKPFRRLDKYSAMLQELERHMESGHPDRGDTQRSVAVYKDIAATCSATRRQKELELQVLTGPVRGWQGQELTTLGDIIHMGSVAVGAEHRDRYFVLFPQTLLILSVSQRMSAFIYEGKLPVSNIQITRLDDTDTVKNAFEITGPLIEKIMAICQGPAEANRWVELLSPPGTFTEPRRAHELKRNVSSSAVNASPQPPPHGSPPNSVGAHTTRAATMSMQQIPQQHKRSLSFNHHLSFNQLNTGAGPNVINKQMFNQPLQIKSKDIVPPPLTVENGKTPNDRNNWNITHLRPAPPLRPLLYGGNLSTTGGNTSSMHSTILPLSSRKVAPTYEEDALVLRVIESYCAAYQSNARNMMHSALQPWTPCLPIRGGKLKSTKHFSTSNPQLPFILHNCPSPLSSATAHNTAGQHINNNHSNNVGGNNSSSSLNSSYIWREASPNSFNMYSASISSSLNSTSYRYSLGTSQQQNASHSASQQPPACIQQAHMSPQMTTDWRTASEDKSRIGSTSGSGHHLPSKFGGKSMASKLCGYDNLQHSSCGTPLLSRRTQHHQLPVKTGRAAHLPPTSSKSSTTTPQMASNLYDRRLNRSFETPPLQELNRGDLKLTTLRRSTPHLAHDEVSITSSTRNSTSTTSWCCGNFMKKQWRKLNSYE